MFKLTGIITDEYLFLLTNPNAASNWSSASKMLGQFFFLVVGFAVIIIMAIYSLRIAAKFKGISGFNSNLRVVETRALGFNNYVHLVKVGNKYLLIGTSKTNVALLSEIEEETVIDNFERPEGTNFDGFLTSYLNKLKPKKKE